MKTLIVYYSYSGHTQKIAKQIQLALGGDIIQIETVKSYPEVYDRVVEIAKAEVYNKEMPPIKPIEVDLTDYDSVIIGTPVWWYTYAPAIRTFLENADLSGKQVYAFATNEGGIGSTAKDFDKGAKGTDYKGTLNVLFSGDTLITPVKKIETWISSIK